MNMMRKDVMRELAAVEEPKMREANERRIGPKSFAATEFDVMIHGIRSPKLLHGFVGTL